MKKKSHERAPGKKGFSVALPEKLVAEIQAIANSETRSRNGQIEKFLEDCVKAYKSENAPEKKPTPMIVGLNSPKKSNNNHEAK